jgi:hypothetical protein
MSYLDQGTDLPSTSLPVGASRCAMKAPVRCIAVRSLLVAGGWLVAGTRRAASTAVGGAAGVYGGPRGEVKESTSFVLAVDTDSCRRRVWTVERSAGTVAGP